MSGNKSGKKSGKKFSKRKPAKPAHPEPDLCRVRQDDMGSARRKLCSVLRFWQICGHKKCLRVQACVHASNECFERFWPLLPEPLKHAIRAGIEAGAAGLPRPEIAAAMARAAARWHETQSLNAAALPSVAQVPSRPTPAPATPRIRVL